jgi:hypothetical protein
VSKKTGEPEPEPENRESGKRETGVPVPVPVWKNQKPGTPVPGFWYPVFTGLPGTVLNKYIFLFFLCGQPYIWEIFARFEIGISEHLVYVGILFLFDEDLIEKMKTEPRYVKASSLNKFGIGFLISRWMLWLKT